MAKKNKKSKTSTTEAELPKGKIQLGTRDIFNACLPFERSVVEMEKKIHELRKISQDGVDLSEEIVSAEKKLKEAIREIFEKLTPWQRVQVARHPLRPFTLDYVNYLTTDFTELHGDRRFSDDRAIVTGFAKWAMARGSQAESREFSIEIPDSGKNDNNLAGRVRRIFGK